jgi:hypothetical protein
LLKNAKAKGSRRERQERKIREREGAIVQKAGGSLGDCDLIALYPKEGAVVGIQVKSNGFPGSQEMGSLAQLVREFSATPSWRVEVVRWDDGEPIPGKGSAPVVRRIYRVLETGDRELIRNESISSNIPEVS